MSKNISPEIPSEEARRLAASPAGKQLLAALGRSDTERLQAAAQQAMQGDPEAAKQLLLPLLQDPQIAALLQQLGG